jgi:O-antigen/teichoic acid export membrane protein
MSFLKKTLMTFGTKLLLFVLGMFTSILTARILGPEGKGVVAIAFLIPNFVASLGSLSIGSANVYLLGKRKHELRDVFSNSVILSVLFSLVYIALFLVFFELLREYFFKAITPLYVLIPFFALPISLFIRYGEGILRGLYEIKQYNLVMILDRVSFVVYLVLFLVVLKIGVFGAIVATLLGFLTIAAYLFIHVHKRSGFHLWLNTKLLADSLRFGMKEHIGNIAQRLNLRFDMLFITALWGPAYVGFYTVSVAIAELVWYIPDSIGIVLFPKISSVTKEDAGRFTPFVCRNGLFIAVICSILLAAVCKPAVRIMYGVEFLPSVTPLLLLLPGVIFLTVGKILTKYTSGIGKPEYNTYASLAALVVTAISLALLVPRYNIIGAAISTSIAYFAFSGTITCLYIKESGNGVFETLVMKREDFRVYRQALRELLSR